MHVSVPWYLGTSKTCSHQMQSLLLPPCQVTREVPERIAAEKPRSLSAIASRQRLTMKREVSESPSQAALRVHQQTPAHAV